jgi:hypothetical protein
MSARVVYPVPTLPSQPESQRRPFWFPWKSVLGTSILAILLLVVECNWLRGRQQERSIAWANEQVEDKIAAARLLLTEKQWDEAIRRLEEALDIENATNRDAVRPVLEEVQCGQAETLLEAAGHALTHRHTDEALRLLRAYLAHPQATHLDRARSLRDELERALSEDEAARLLGRLSDEALAVFAEKGQLTVDDGMHTVATRAIFQETLRRNLPAEQRKREAQHEVSRLTAKRRAEEKARRIADLRATPAFHALSTFLAQTQEQWREEQRLATQQDVEMNELFQALGVNDAAEQQQIRADLAGRQTPAALREQIERKRAEIKNAYRKGPDFNPADAVLFDQLVDQEVDKALKMLNMSG